MKQATKEDIKLYLTLIKKIHKLSDKLKKIKYYNIAKTYNKLANEYNELVKQHNDLVNKYKNEQSKTD